MRKLSKFAAAAVVTNLALFATAAHAQAVNATLAAQYYRVAVGSDSDFPGGTPVVALGSGLGLNGLPIGTGVADRNAATGEITWWSPVLDTNVQATGVGTINLPYAGNMYAPNSTGANDNAFYETAVFTGAFTLATPSTVQFSLGSDDDSFIYVDGTLFGQNPGIHGVTNVTFTTQALGAGAHSLKVFYADREQTGAYLSLSLLSTGVVITPPAVPEPATWALMLVGFGATGAAMRRRRRTTVRFA